MRSPHVTVQTDLARIRRNLIEIRSLAGVPILAVVKSDGYGLGLDEILPVLNEIADGYCVLSPREAVDARIFERTGKSTLSLCPGSDANTDDLLAHNIRPAVWTVEEAGRLRKARPVVAVDTGMQRFACPIERVHAIINAGGCTEAFTHARTLEQVRMLTETTGTQANVLLHAAGSSLLHEPAAHLGAVRPGIAMYRGAVRVSTPLFETHRSTGPAGYSGFSSRTGHHGVILAGYANGLRAGPCIINGNRSRIVEVGMQSSFVETWPTDRPGDEVVLLGDGMGEEDLAAARGSSLHEALVSAGGLGIRKYVSV